MKPEDRQALLTIGRKFLVMFSVILASLLLGLWFVSQIFPVMLGQIYQSSLVYVVTATVIVATTFGGLYSAVYALRSRENQEMMAGEEASR